MLVSSASRSRRLDASWVRVCNPAEAASASSATYPASAAPASASSLAWASSPAPKARRVSSIV